MDFVFVVYCFAFFAFLHYVNRRVRVGGGRFEG